MIYRHIWKDHVAVYNHSDRGFCKLTTFVQGDQKIACLYDLVVYPWMRGTGYGRALLEWAIKVASSDGCDAIILWHDGEPWVKEWYTRRGFVESNIMQSENGDPCMLLDLKKSRIIKQ